MEGQACPLLGSLSEQGVYLNYPNFENRCYATGRSESVPLAQQQFFCLGGQFGTCPRHVAATRGRSAAPQAHTAPPLSPAWDESAAETLLDEGAPEAPGRRNGWLPYLLGAGGVFLALVLCLVAVGGFLAWRSWSTRLRTDQPTPVVAGPVTIRPATFTPTPAAPTVDPNVAAAFATVTAVARLTAEAGTLEPPPFSLTPRPTPTRRPTPLDGTVFPDALATETPTATPLPDLGATATPTGILPPTATVAPTEPLAPIINFSAAPRTILLGQCATLRWNTAGIEAVYLDVDGTETGVTGVGSRQVCPLKDTDYYLRVVLRDLTDQIWVANVQVRGTPTPSVTPTNTATPFYTATPTPTNLPTATPTVTPQYGVHINGDSGQVTLTADGIEHQVAALTVQNTGNTSDQIAISLSGSLPAGWRLLLCLNGSEGDRCFTDNTTEVTMPAAGVQTAQVRMVAPSGTASGTSTVVTLEAVSRHDAATRTSVQLTVVVS